MVNIAFLGLGRMGRAMAARLLAAGGKDTPALEQMLGATRTLSRLANQRPEVAVLRSELASCLFSSATVLDGIGSMGDAREARAQAAEELLRLLKAEPGNLELRLDLAGCYGAMAEAAILSGDVASAESTSKAAAKLLEELMRQWPDSADVRSRLAAQRWVMAGILRDRGKTAEALALIDEGILLVERISVGASADPVAPVVSVTRVPASVRLFKGVSGAGVCRVRATSPVLGTMRGNTPSGTPNNSHSQGSQRRVSRCIRLVRDAFVTSMTCGAPAAAPPASHQTRKESTVPNASSPRSARWRTPWVSSNHASFVAEK